MTATTQINLQLPTPNTAQDADCPSPLSPSSGSFGCAKLHQQAQKVKNATVNFCQTTFDNLRALGDTAIDFSKNCNEELGEEKGKSAFNNWLESDGFGVSKYVLRLAMKIAERYSNLKPRVQKLLRDNVQRWGLRALRDLFSVGCDKLLEALVRSGTRSHRVIKNTDGTLEGKQPKLPLGGLVELLVEDERQLKGKIGVIDNKDEHGNIVVKLVDTGAHVTVKNQDLTKRPPKSINQSLLEIIDHLHEESLEKDLKLSEYQSAVVPESTTEILAKSERDLIAAEAVAKYEQSQAEEQEKKEAALYEKAKAAALSEVRAEYDAVLASANAQNEALNQSIQKLAKQVEDKERLTQVIEDLQEQLKDQARRAQHLEEQNQQLEQQVAEFQSALAGTVDLPDKINKQESFTIVDSVVSSNYDIQLQKIESRQSYNEPAGSPEIFLPSELDEYKAAKLEKPADYIEISQAEFLSIKKKLETSESSNLELAETIEVLRDVINIIKTEQAEKEWGQNIHKLGKQLGQMSLRNSTAPPRGVGNAVSKR